MDCKVRVKSYFFFNLDIDLFSKESKMVFVKDKKGEKRNGFRVYKRYFYKGENI